MKNTAELVTAARQRLGLSDAASVNALGRVLL